MLLISLDSGVSINMNKIKQLKKICFHHNDADGKMSAAIVAQAHPDCEFVECKYGNIVDSHIIGFHFDLIFIVDFSFSLEVINTLFKPSLVMNKGKLIWIDHHETAKKNYSDLWYSDKIDGKREIGKCGALLTWEWFYPHRAIPEFILLVNDYDLGLHRMGEETHHFAEYLANSELRHYIDLLNGTYSLTDSLHLGKPLFIAKKGRCERQIARGQQWPLKIKHGILGDCYWVNCLPEDASLIGQMVLDKGYAIAIGYYVDNTEMSYSLRSKGDLDVSKIAEEFGGGGHKNAAGFTKQFTITY